MPMLRAVAVYAFLSAGLCGAKDQCVAKDKSIHGYTESTFIPMFLGLVSKSLTDTLNAKPDLKKVLQDRGKCQFECFTKVATESARFVWTLENAPRKKGDPTSQDAAKQMFVGAFETCYPGLAEKEHTTIATVMSNVVAGMGDYGTVKPIPLVNPSQTACPGKSTNPAVDKATFDLVMGKFGASQETVMNLPKYKDLKNYLNTGGFDCQDACSGKTATAAINNLWQSGLFAAHPGSRPMVEAYTGSFKACYPSIPRNMVHGFAQDVFAAAMAAARSAATQRLDDATSPNLLQTATSSGFMVAAFAGSVLLVGALLVVKRKSQQPKRDLIAVSGQNDLETDLDGETEKLNLALE